MTGANVVQLNVPTRSVSWVFVFSCYVRGRKPDPGLRIQEAERMPLPQSQTVDE